MSRNRLGQEASPYLQQHRDNPVHWYAWGEAALQEAKRADKPILLSVGYSACHWCHVMAHESFENPNIASLMNELYVNIKVDREERPDLDAIYQRALSLIGQQGGWPLTMFLTPEGAPFWGGTYFPPEPRWGRPGFGQVLQMVHETYRQEPEKVEKNRVALTDALQRLAESRPGGPVTRETLDHAAEALLHEVDPRHGGIGGAPKFPQTGMFELLWRNYRRTGSQFMRTAVLLTMERISQGGIYDHLGGGYARYSTDERWLAPHFEKMLYDNAQLLELLCEVWLDSGDPLFQQRARETVTWLLREMRTKERAFAAALDADSEGVEGRYYVWSEAEIDQILAPDDAALFKAVYDVSAKGNWEGTNILNRLRRLPGDPVIPEERLGPMRARLFEAREKRVRPGWDDKVLADWNGLAIAALAEAAGAFDERAWFDAARAAYDYVAHGMSTDDRLRHVARHGQIKNVAFLDDYAAMARAALALYQLTGEESFLDDAKAWVVLLDADYWDGDKGGYFYTPAQGERLIARAKNAHDAATPSGNGVMVGVLARLYYLTGEDAYRKRADDVVAAFSGELEQNFAALVTLLNEAEFLAGAVQIVVIGTRTEPAAALLIRAIYQTSVPNRVLLVSAPGANLPANHPAAGKSQENGKATAYVCVGPVCSLPLTEPARLIEALHDACARVLA